MREVVQIPIPDDFIGKWCLTFIYGTHGSYSILAFNMVFENEEHAKAYRTHYLKDKGYNYPDYYLEPMKIEKNYPVWQTEIYMCGMSSKELNKLTK